MSERDPTRFREPGGETPPELRALFEAGSADLPSDAQLESLATKLGSTLGPAPVAVAAASGVAVGVKLGIGVVAAVGVAALVWSVRSRPTVEPAAVASASAVALSPRSAPAIIAPPPSANAPPLSAPPAVESVVPGVTARSSPSAPQRVVESEAAYLERARGSLASDPALALSLANRHRSRFPDGVLSQEREVIAIDALKRLGQSAEAARRLAAFSSRYPGSAYRQKLDAGAGR